MTEDRIEDSAYSALFRRVQGSVFSNGDYTYAQKTIYYEDIEEGDVLDEKRLKIRLKDKIIRLNNARIEKYNLEINKIYDDSSFELKKFKIIKQNEKGNSGRYALYPLEFICDCGKYFYAFNNDELSKLPTFCPECNSRIKQNTIVLFCPSCGQFSPISPWCKLHGQSHMYIERPKKDNISTWKQKCKACGGEGEGIHFTCKNCKHKAEPLTIRDGGLVNPVVYTYVDLEKIKTSKDPDVIRYAIDHDLINRDKILELAGIDPLNNNVKTKTTDEIIAEIECIASSSMFAPSENAIRAYEYITSTKNSIKEQFSDDSLRLINDIQAIINNSICLHNFNFQNRREYQQNSIEISEQLGIVEIHYTNNLRLVASCIGVINGINKYYDPSYVPHFNAFEFKKDSKEYCAIIHPIKTEGLLFELDAKRICDWLYSNGLVESAIEHGMEKEYILHLSEESSEYVQIKTLIHSFSHGLIKQSSIHTGLDEGTCSEMLFVNNCAFLIYSTSNINIGGFEYLFKYSLLDWFRELKYSIEDCTFDPVCKKDGGKCFSCMYLQEHVCTEFNQNLSRLTMIGGGEYQNGFWNLSGE